MIDNGVRTIIHLQNLRANIRMIMTRCRSLLPIVKSDAYGHGLIRTAKALIGEGIDQLAVGTVGEGVRIRQAGLHAGLVALLGALDRDDAEKAAALDVMPLLHSFDECARFEALHMPVDVVIKCDTGMARLGFTTEELPELIRRLKRHPNIHPRIVMSHLACADENGKDQTTLAQMRLFEDSYIRLRDDFRQIRPSLLNSAGLLICPELTKNDSLLSRADFCRDLARPGLTLYGGNPLAGTPREALGNGFLPVMETRTRVLAVHPLSKGQSLSYGHAFIAPKDMSVAVIAAGYAEGYPRSLSNRGQVAFAGGRAPLVGRVCMQMAFADVTTLPQVKTGDMVWLLGGPNDGMTPPITASELAAWAGLIPYELLCAFGKNERQYVS